jgi:hypothetical protein
MQWMASRETSSEKLYRPKMSAGVGRRGGGVSDLRDEREAEPLRGELDIKVGVQGVLEGDLLSASER